MLEVALRKGWATRAETSQIQDFFKLPRNMSETRVWQLNNIGQIYNPELVTSGLKLGHELHHLAGVLHVAEKTHLDPNTTGPHQFSGHRDPRRVSPFETLARWF